MSDEVRLFDQIAVLWPHLNFTERYDWIKRLQVTFNRTFEDTAKEIIDRVSN